MTQTHFLQTGDPKLSHLGNLRSLSYKFSFPLFVKVGK